MRRAPLTALFLELLGHRHILAEAWCKETIAPTATFVQRHPQGQSGPTALWVTRFLREEGYPAMFASGTLTVHRRTHAAPRHHWTQVGDYVVDLTGTQVRGYAYGAVCETVSELTQQRIYYQAASLMRPGNSVEKDIRRRHEVLVRQIKRNRSLV